MKKINIAFLTKNFCREEKDASITTVLKLAQELNKAGHNVHIITERGKSAHNNSLRNLKFEIINDIPVHRYYFSPLISNLPWYLNPPLIFNRFLAAPLSLRKIEKEHKIKFDIIHTFAGALPFIMLGFLAKKISTNKKIKFVHTIKSYSLHDAYWFSPGSLFWSKLLNLAEQVILPSELMSRKLITKGLNKNKIKIINSFIDLDKFKPKNKKEMKVKYGFQNKKIILYYGQWGKQKGVRRLIKISPGLNKKIKNLKILFVHPSWPTMKDGKFFEKFKKVGNLELIQKKVKIEDYINLADLVVLPYTTIKGTETNPLCILESMACKTPIVTSNFGELKEILSPETEVLMSSPIDNSQLSKQIIRLMNNEKLRHTLSENAYRKISKYDIQLAKKKHLELYEKLIS